MALSIKDVVAFLMITTLFQVVFAAVYKVGDCVGWTSPAIDQVDYNKWASSKKFHVGDVIVFSYNKLLHDVKQVTQQHFKICNAKSPIATYTSGFDSIPSKRLETTVSCAVLLLAVKLDRRFTLIKVNPIPLSPGAGPPPTPIPPNASVPLRPSAPPTKIPPNAPVPLRPGASSPVPTPNPPNTSVPLHPGSSIPAPTPFPPNTPVPLRPGANSPTPTPIPNAPSP